MSEDREATTAGSPSPEKGWQTARQRFRQLEFAAGRMSPRWFAGHMGVIAAASLSLVTAVVLGFSLARMLHLTEDVERIQNVLLQSMALQEAMDESGAAARGYLLNRDPELLAGRAAANARFLGILSALAGQHPSQAAARAQLDEIRSTASRRMRIFDDLVASPNQTGAAAKNELAESLRLARRTNAALTAFRSGQQIQLHDVENGLRQTMEFSIGLVLFAGLSTPLFGALGVRLLRRAEDDQRTRELQSELMHVQRLAIMGETSAMLAHEINQPLAAALNYLAVLRRHLEAGAIDKAQMMADRLGQQIHRAGNILGKLRRFIEKRETERMPETPDVLVEDAITLLGTIDGTVELHTDIGPALPRVLVDRVQMQQVLVNLMRNAIEAMQDSPRRELTLSVRSTDSHTVQISLADTGPGLSAEVAERLFQPFVSTKAGGMGVGLSICHSIVSRNGGRIWVEPNASGGTIFRFTLPAAKECVAA